MEQQVCRIWTVLSAFEQSSAACISDLAQHVNNEEYLDGIRIVEKLVLHIEVLFAAIDDLEYQFSQLNTKGECSKFTGSASLMSCPGMSRASQTRLLCLQTLEIFMLFSHVKKSAVEQISISEKLLILLTKEARYLKLIIGIALTGALELEREHASGEVMSNFLNKFHVFEVQGFDPNASRLIRGSNGEPMKPILGAGNYGTQGVMYGFRSLAPENMDDGLSSISGEPPTETCVKCGQAVDEDCVRLGTCQRWHFRCLQCLTCGKVAAVPTLAVASAQSSLKDGDERDSSSSQNVSSQSSSSNQRRTPANVGMFVYDPASMQAAPPFGNVPTQIYCLDHAHPGCSSGFEPVQRLEQYSFLLNVGLQRMFVLLKQRGVIHAVTGVSTSDETSSSNQVATMSSGISVDLDQKPRATARLSKGTMIAERSSPTGASSQVSTGYPQLASDSALPSTQESSSGLHTAAVPSSSYQSTGYGDQASLPPPPTSSQPRQRSLLKWIRSGSGQSGNLPGQQGQPFWPYRLPLQPTQKRTESSEQPDQPQFHRPQGTVSANASSPTSAQHPSSKLTTAMPSNMSDPESSLSERLMSVHLDQGLRGAASVTRRPPKRISQLRSLQHPQTASDDSAVQPIHRPSSASYGGSALPSSHVHDPPPSGLSQSQQQASQQRSDSPFLPRDDPAMRFSIAFRSLPPDFLSLGLED